MINKLNRTIYIVSGIILTGLLLLAVAEQRDIFGIRDLEFERVTLLPLSPVPRGPTGSEFMRGTYEIKAGGPVMAIVYKQKIYVVDDVKRKLLECSMNGKILRELAFPKDAPKSLSGVLNLCLDLLWVGFEYSPYTFAVDLDSWCVVEERRWKGKGVVAGLFAMPDRTIYVIMPEKVLDYDIVWQLIKISSEGNQQSQVIEGWQPTFVDEEENIYWVNRPDPRKSSPLEIKIAYNRFGKELKLIGKIHGNQFKAYSAYWAFNGPIVGITKDGILCRGGFTAINWMADLFLHFSFSGKVVIIGKEPIFKHPIRSLDLPGWWMCDGRIYSIMREDIGEYARFWLIRLKL